jgi:N,N'-diacetyllegionaminate synthase
MGKAVSRTLVIAEPGCTAEGNYGAMLRLLKVAADAGADVWKPQWTSNPERMCERRKAPDYLPFYRWLAFPVEWHQTLSDVCHSFGMKYAVSVYLPEDVATVSPFADYIKIASSENINYDVIDAAMHVGMRPTLVSAGGLDFEDVVNLWSRIDAEHAAFMAVLQCTATYPAPLDEMQLRLLRRFPELFQGLSDHSKDGDVGAYAACAGARFIETHYRLFDCDPANPDYAVALDPGEFTVYIGRIRKAERVLGSGVKRVQPSEAAMLKFKVTA